jgi:hypothetical protein
MTSEDGGEEGDAEKKMFSGSLSCFYHFISYVICHAVSHVRPMNSSIYLAI